MDVAIYQNPILNTLGHITFIFLLKNGITLIDGSRQVQKLKLFECLIH